MRYYSALLLLLVAMTVAAQNRPEFDAAYPDVHDPVMALGEDGRYYIFSTGMGISVMSSSDMKTWRQEKSVFSTTMVGRDGKEHHFEGNAEMPAWTTDSVPGFRGHFWAPDISYHPSTGSGQGGKWYLYYSCSTFGKNGSAIGLATNKTLDPSSPYYKWEDQGAVIVSHRNKDNWNAIDPNLAPLKSPLQGEVLNGNSISPLKGAGGLFYGSFWDGIQMLTLADDLKTPTSAPRTVARRLSKAVSLDEVTNPETFTMEGNETIEAGDNAIEAPFVIENNGYYYLFVSWDYCCRGRSSTYKTVYGRSRDINGPYLDKQGNDMAFGGGTYLVGPDDNYYGIGHCSAYQFNGQWYFVSHAYDIEKNGQAKLYLRQFHFDPEGWIAF